MKKILILWLILLSTASFAQVEFAKGDTSATSLSTRIRVGVNSSGRLGQKGSSGNFSPFALYSEVVAATGSTVTNVNGVAPSAGTVTITTSNIAEGTNLYWTTARGDARYPQLSGSYTNPSWLVSIPFSKLTSTPTTVSGYGITDGVTTGGTYSNPSWLTALAASKVTGLATVATSGLFADVGSKPTTLSGYGITDAALSTAVVPYSSVSAYSNLSGVAAPASGYLKFVRVATDERYSESNSLYIIDSASKITKIVTIKEN